MIIEYRNNSKQTNKQTNKQEEQNYKIILYIP